MCKDLHTLFSVILSDTLLHHLVFVELLACFVMTEASDVSLMDVIMLTSELIN